MIQVIYIEDEVRDHPRVGEVLARFPKAQRVPCERYGEVFNRRAQSFRLQKQRPALILAKKHDGHVLPTPEGYGVGGSRNYYFSHLLNCPYDCRYCFLQGMYRSAHYVLFVNYEDFQSAIDRRTWESEESGAIDADSEAATEVASAAALANTVAGSDREAEAEEVWFFSGYDSDSLAFETVTGFADHFLDFFARRPQAHLELRTKSVQIRGLLDREPLDNVVVAFSLSPATVAENLEHGAPSLDRRLDALVRLQRHGWPIGLRFDPLIRHRGDLDHYRGLFTEVFGRLAIDGIHSVSLGNFRLPRPFYRRLVRLYPEEPLFALPMADHNGMVSYPERQTAELFDGCRQMLLQHVPEELYFPCSS